MGSVLELTILCVFCLFFLFEGEGLSVHTSLTWVLALDSVAFPKFLEMDHHSPIHVSLGDYWTNEIVYMIKFMVIRRICLKFYVVYYFTSQTFS